MEGAVGLARGERQRLTTSDDALPHLGSPEVAWDNS